MAPNAECLRRRNAPHEDTVNPDQQETLSRSSIVAADMISKLKSNEVVIDGDIYDLNSFAHPGGESILIFGGNDATVQYKMIHPYHTERNLLKMKKLGSIPNYKCEYKFDTPFEKEVKQEVLKIVGNVGNQFGTTDYFLRVAIYLLFFFYAQFLWVKETSYTLAIFYGVANALIGLNVQHDANHGAASRKVWINDLLGLGADFIGGNKWLWMEKHWTHHAFTNHHKGDPDGLAAEPLVIFNNYKPESGKRKFIHSFQGFYVVLILSGYWLSSVFDLQHVWELRDRGTLATGVKLDNAWIRSKAKYAVSLRLIYIFINIIIPLYKNPSLTTLGHINVFGIAGSLGLGLLFVLSHNFEHADRDPTQSARQTGEGVCWFKSQVETSSTYGGTMAGYLTGGLNFQVEHHLFPRMSSAWYPKIAPTVRRVCKKHGVRYTYYPWVWQNMISTLRYTHAVGNGFLHHIEGNPFKGEQ